MESTFDIEKYKLAVNLLYEEKKRFVNIVMRKEIAAWAALVVYTAILGFIISTLNNESLLFPIFLTVFVIILSCIFFAFIHTQYSSIHASEAGGIAVTQIITIILKKESLDFSKLKINDEQGEFQCIIDKLQFNLKQITPYRGKKHPVKIMLDFVKFRWASSKPKKREGLYDSVIQEAALNWLILILMLSTLLYLWVTYISTSSANHVYGLF